MQDSSVLCESITKVMAGSIVADDGFNTISRYFGLHTFPSDAKKFLSNIIQELFTESDPMTKVETDLGGLALKVVLDLTSREFETPDTADTVISAEPILYCYGRLSELYIDLLRQAKEIREVGKD